MPEVKPLISVIVAAYNQERYIGRCLRSLLHQTLDHSKYEIIVVDDGSTDKTPYALNLFCDPKNSVVKIITNKVNLGLPASLNLAIKASKSEYLVRVDSDDFVNENFLNLLHLYLETNPLSDAIACDYLLLDDNESVLEKVNCIDEPIACGIMFRKNNSSISDCMMKAFDCMKRRNFESDLKKVQHQKNSDSSLSLPQTLIKHYK